MKAKRFANIIKTLLRAFKKTPKKVREPSLFDQASIITHQQYLRGLHTNSLTEKELKEAIESWTPGGKA